MPVTRFYNLLANTKQVMAQIVLAMQTDEWTADRRTHHVTTTCSQPIFAFCFENAILLFD